MCVYTDIDTYMYKHICLTIFNCNEMLNVKKKSNVRSLAIHLPGCASSSAVLLTEKNALFYISAAKPSTRCLCTTTSSLSGGSWQP